MQLILRLRSCILGLTLLLVSCAGTAIPTDDGLIRARGKPDQETYRRVHRLLAQGGTQLSYANLTKISAAMSAARRPIEHMHDLLARMIEKRNPHPRVDQMILIYAARAIGDSPFRIPRAGQLFHTMLDQQARMSEWVIAFVADGIERYPYDMSNGDALVDRLEATLVEIRNAGPADGEMFGFHFLPPPRRARIRSYLNGIHDRRQREQERHRYYRLIRQHIGEDDIAASLAVLQARDHDGSGPPCRMKMRCLLEMADKIPLH